MKNETKTFKKDCIIQAFQVCQTKNNESYCKIQVLDEDGKQKLFYYFDYDPTNDYIILKNSYKKVFTVTAIIKTEGFSCITNIDFTDRKPEVFKKFQEKMFSTKELAKTINFIKTKTFKKYQQLLKEHFLQKKVLESFVRAPLSSDFYFKGVSVKYLNILLKLSENLIDFFVLQNNFSTNLVINKNIVYTSLIFYVLEKSKYYNVSGCELYIDPKAEVFGENLVPSFLNKEEFPIVYGILNSHMLKKYQKTIEGRLFYHIVHLSKKMFEMDFAANNEDELSGVLPMVSRNYSYNLIYPTEFFTNKFFEDEKINE